MKINCENNVFPLLEKSLGSHKAKFVKLGFEDQNGANPPFTKGARGIFC